MSVTKQSVYIAYLLRHDPGSLSLTMDEHGWVSVGELLEKIHGTGKYAITKAQLDEIVRRDNKGRFRYSDDGLKIKACQGHSIPGVEPELTFREPPKYLYHGTTLEAWRKIQESGSIRPMGRHAVHMQAEAAKAWQSAKRWKKVPVVLKIDAGAMYADGAVFGISDNGVWCVDSVPVEWILSDLYEEKE